MERAWLMAQLRATRAVEERGGFVFLKDPHWSESERAAAAGLFTRADELPPPTAGWLGVRTGGTSGALKLARHDEATIGAAIDGYRAHFRLDRVNAVGVLPPWHVSGLMARLRCAATGGTYIDADWKQLEAGSFPPMPSDRSWVISLVPTQLARLLASRPAIAWLARFRVIHLGGGPTWSELADAASAERLPVSLSYGMTETAAMITAQQPEEFWAGDRSAGCVMPHASVAIDSDGRVAISGGSLFRGYFPETRVPDAFVTQDLGRVDESGRLHLLGRADAMIITGGKKVQPIEVEAALRASGEFEDVAVIGVPDAEWGEAVVACYPATTKVPDLARANAALAAHQRPKRFVAVRDWPRNAQGKINRAALKDYLEGGGSL